MGVIFLEASGSFCGEEPTHAVRALAPRASPLVTLRPRTASRLSLAQDVALLTGFCGFPVVRRASRGVLQIIIILISNENIVAVV